MLCNNAVAGSIKIAGVLIDYSKSPTSGKLYREKTNFIQSLKVAFELAEPVVKSISLLGDWDLK
jgi:hypothetical protein